MNKKSKQNRVRAYDFAYGARGAYRYGDYGRRSDEASDASPAERVDDGVPSREERPYPGGTTMFGGRGAWPGLDDLQLRRRWWGG